MNGSGSRQFRATWFFVLTLALAIGTGAQQAPVHANATVEIWHPFHHELPAGAAFAAIIERFEAENPHISIVQTTLTPNELNERLMIGLVGNSLPDITWGRPLQMIEQGFPLLPLDSYVDPRVLDDFVAGFLGGQTVDDRIYGLPTESSPLSLHYKTAPLLEAGQALPSQLGADAWTWSAFRALTASLTQDRSGDGIPDVWGFGMRLIPRHWGSFLYSAGGSFFDEDYAPSSSAVRSEAGRESLQFLRDLVESDLMFPGSATDITDPRIVMNVHGVWRVQHYIDQGLEFESWYVPRSADGSLSSYTLQAALYAIDHNDAQKAEAAGTFLSWFFHPENHLEWVLATGYLPQLSSVIHSADYAETMRHPGFRGHILATEYGYTAPEDVSLKASNALGPVGALMTQALLGEISVEEALIAMENQMNVELGR